LTKPEDFNGDTIPNLLQQIALTYNESITFKMIPTETTGKCHLSSAIPPFSPILKAFQVKFPPHFDSIKAINTLIQVSGSNKCLQKLGLEFPGTDITDISCALLHNNLTIQRNLRSLKLELAGPKVSSMSLSSLFDEEFQRLPLEEFSACFFNFPNLIDEVMKKLLIGLSRMYTLSNISFNVDKCSVSDNSLQQFKGLLSELQNLEKFSLRIGFTIGAISNKSIQAITQGVKSSINLQHFGLELERKPGITDEGHTEEYQALLPWLCQADFEKYCDFGSIIVHDEESGVACLESRVRSRDR
jgi:hypothetical protein